MEKKTSSKEKEIKTLSLAEQEALVKEELKLFIQKAKDKGFLTIDEINDLLPPEIIATSALDELMQGLELNSIKIVGPPETGKTADGETEVLAEMSGSPDKEEEEEEEEEGEVKEDVKSNDPVRLYLKKMGSVSLLTREGEVEIAQRIEQGEREIVRAMLCSPLGTHEIIQLGKLLDAGRIKVKSIFRGLEDEDTQYDEQEYIEKIHDLIGEVTQYQKKVETAFGVLRNENVNPKDAEVAKAEVAKHNEKLMSQFESINFNRKTINRIVIKFKNLVNRMSTLRRRIKEGIEKTFSKDLTALATRYQIVSSNDKELTKMSLETGINFNRFKSYFHSASDADRRLKRLEQETQIYRGN